MSAQHTPTPYHAATDAEFSGLCVLSDFGHVATICGTEVIDDEARATAAFIVEACNAYASHRAQIKALREALTDCKNHLQDIQRIHRIGHDCIIDAARAALALGNE